MFSYLRMFAIRERAVKRKGCPPFGQMAELDFGQTAPDRGSGVGDRKREIVSAILFCALERAGVKSFVVKACRLRQSLRNWMRTFFESIDHFRLEYMHVSYVFLFNHEYGCNEDLIR